MNELVAVTGATGRVGAPLVNALLGAGRTVRALSRRAQPARAGVEWVTGDVGDQAAVTTLVNGVATVFHAAGQLDGRPEDVERSLVEGTANVLRASRGSKLVYVSSLVVLDTASASPVAVSEDHQLEPDPGRRGPYTRAKCAAEVLARAAARDQDVVIVRPGLVVGQAPEPIPLSVGLRIGRLLFLVGPQGGLLPVVHARDVATGLICAASQLGRGEVVHLIDPMPVTRGRLLSRLLKSDDPLVAVRAGGLAVPLARAVAISHMPRVSGAAYRLLSAGRSHGWNTERGIGLGWHPDQLQPWFAEASA